MPEREKDVIAYVPVIHRGYLELFERFADADIHILDEDVLEEVDYLRKDVRALKPREAKDAIENMNNNLWDVSLLGRTALVGFNSKEIIMPDEDVSRYVAENYLSGQAINFHPIFLRWDRERSLVNKDVEPDRTVSFNEFSEIIDLAFEEANKSADWWRQVGAVVFDQDEIRYKTHNHHLPTEFSNQIDGDPRNTAKRGEAIEASTAIHAEAEAVASAAKNGDSLEGSSILVTTFPCPNCAKLIALSGIKECYFLGGYAMTDGVKVLRDNDVEIVKVEGFNPPEKGTEFKPYPKKKSS